MALEYAFDPAKGETPDSAKEKREAAQAMIARALSSAPQNVGQGLSAIGQALIARQMKTEADQAMAQGQQSANSAWSQILSSAGDGSGSSLVGPSPSSAGAAAPDTDMSGNDIYKGFIDTVENGGVKNPYALAAIASTGNAESKFSPANANRTWNDGANNAGGILSWNGARLNNLMAFAKSKGEGGLGSPQTQAQFFLQENPELIASLNGAKSVDEAQNMMNNAWRFKGYNQPGNPDAARRLAAAQAYLPQFQQGQIPASGAQAQLAAMASPQAGQGANVASLDDTFMPAHPVTPTPDNAFMGYAGSVPSPGFAHTLSGQMAPASSMDMPTVEVQKGPRIDPGSTQSISPQEAAQPASPSAPTLSPFMPQEAMYAPQGEQQTDMANLAEQFGGSQQLANADPKQGILQALLARGTSPAPQVPVGQAQSGPTTQALIAAVGNPWLSDSQKAVAGAILKQKLAKEGPVTPVSVAPGSSLVNPRTGQVVYKGADKQQFTKIGSDEYGNPTYGFVDPSSGKVTPLDQSAGNGSAAGSGAYSQSETGMLHGDDFLQTLPPSLGQQVKAYATGRMPMPTGYALKSPYFQKMMQMVTQYDPSFDAVNYGARYKTRSDFTSGKSSQSINALNTVIGHLQSLTDAGDALGNSNYPIWNSVKNIYENATGDPRIKDFDTTKKAVVDELTRVWRGTGGSEGDIKTWGAQINAANSPDQLHSVVAKIGDLLESKLNALSETYSQGMGTTENPMQFVTPKAQKALEQMRSYGTKASGSKSAPSVGTVQDGYRFKGGDPSKKENWEQVM